MEGHVNVTVLSRSRYAGGEDTLAFAGSGILKQTETGWHLRYTASSQDGSRLASDLRLAANGATVRNITEDYTLTLLPGQTTQARIPTAMGPLRVDVCTRSLDWQLAQAPGRITTDYTLTALGQTLSDLHLTVYLTYK